MASETPPRDEPSEGEQQPDRKALNAATEGLDRFQDVPIEISVRLDRKPVKVAQVLEFQVGSVIELPKSAGENVDLLMDGKFMGNGEIVVIEDTMGLRITDLRSTGGKRKSN